MTLPTLPSLVRGRVVHQRRSPWNHALSFTTYQWLIDLDAVPNGSVLAAFPTKDHFGGSAESIRDAVAEFADAQGACVHRSDRILMLAAGRSFGRAFDPLSVFWCLDSSGSIRWALLEIHNTYGERHAQIVYPDHEGKARITKEFYVSPFFDVDGAYDVRLNLSAEQVSVSIHLEQQGERVFSAAFSGVPKKATVWELARATLRTPFVTWQTTTRIRIHGIWLWLRRLPVVPPPPHPVQAGMK